MVENNNIIFGGHAKSKIFIVLQEALIFHPSKDLHVPEKYSNKIELPPISIHIINVFQSK